MGGPSRGYVQVVRRHSLRSEVEGGIGSEGSGPMIRLQAMGQAIRTGFWAVPSACVVLAIAIALVGLS